MVFEVRGGQISMYFRSKFGSNLGRHFGDHLDLIFTSFWSHFGVLGEHFGDLGGSRTLSKISSILEAIWGSVLTTPQTKNQGGWRGRRQGRSSSRLL